MEVHLSKTRRSIEFFYWIFEISIIYEDSFCGGKWKLLVSGERETIKSEI